MSSALSSTSISSSVRRSTVLNPEETDLWELCYYAGVTIDPQVFRILVDLLHMDVHPKAVLDVMKSIAPHSKYLSKSDKGDKKERLSKTSSNSIQKTSETKQKASKSSVDMKSLPSGNHSHSKTRSSSSDRRNLSAKTTGSKSQTSLPRASFSVKKNSHDSTNTKQ